MNGKYQLMWIQLWIAMVGGSVGTLMINSGNPLGVLVFALAAIMFFGVWWI